MAQGREGKWAGGCWHHLGLLPKLPVPGPGRGRDQKDNRVKRQGERQTDKEVDDEQGKKRGTSFSEQSGVKIQAQAGRRENRREEFW